MLRTIVFLALPVRLLLAAAAPTPPPVLTLRDGRSFHLSAPARRENGKVIFTTTEGKTYSLDAADVVSEVDRPPTPTRAPKVYSPMDSQNLGAIARQERAKTGKTTDLSSQNPTPRATKTPTQRPARTATPKTTPTPHPHR